MNKKTVKLLIVAGVALLTLLVVWPFKMIDPGYVGVVVDYFGTSQGVEPHELHVGVHLIPPWKTVYEFPIFQQNDTWEDKEDFQFQTSEGLSIRADIGISFHLTPSAVPSIFQKYRRGMHEISHVFIRNFIRDAVNMCASKLKIEDLYGPAKEQFFLTVEKHVRNDLTGIGINVDRIYLIGRFFFPDNVMAALNSKIEAIQRAQQRENELREAEAQAKKDIAQSQGKAQCIMLSARAQAEANRELAQSISPNLLEWEKTKKWDGVLPRYTGGACPMLSIK